MKLDEIELVSIGNSFPVEQVRRYLERASPTGTLDDLVVHYVESGNHRGIILADDDDNIAAYASFVVRLNGRVWQAKNAVSYEPFKGRQLVGKIYRLVREKFGKSIQSDTEQTVAGMRLWTKTLPALGLNPKVYDTETGHIIDPGSIDIYPHSGSADQHRYTWILERNDHYPEQNLLNESSLLMPNRGLWYNGGIRKRKVNP